MTADLAALEARIGHVFGNRALLTQALTHSSFDDGRDRNGDNQRLEFLGDRVLGLFAAERLCERFEAAREGGLAPRLNELVSRKTCARVARQMELGPALRLGKSEFRAGGADKESILGDACEALIAAIYLDAGVDVARAFFDRWWAEELAAVTAKPKDPKSALQEWAARKGLGQPAYVLSERGGPDHRPVFRVTVTLGPLAPATGEGGSKQEAERAAAGALLAREKGKHK